MPISYQFDPANQIVREFGTGAVTLEEFLNQLASLDKELPTDFALKVLSDYRQVDSSNIPTDSIARMKQATNEMLTAHRATAKTAVVVNHTLHYGLVRMYGMLEHNPNFVVNVFADIDEARAWLDID